MYAINPQPSTITRFLEIAKTVADQTGMLQYMYVEPRQCLNLSDTLPTEVAVRGGYWVFTKEASQWVPSTAEKFAED